MFLVQFFYYTNPVQRIKFITMSKIEIVNEIHKPARKNFKRRCVTLKGIDDLWQADLIDIQNLRQYNKGFNYILVVIDCFTKFVWTVALKSKKKNEIKNSFKNLFLRLGRKPRNLQTDMGTEFYNSDFKSLMNTFKINHYSTYSVKKASIVERVIRTLKSNLYKHFNIIGNHTWIGEALNNIVEKYNNSKHRVTKFKPIHICPANENEVKNNIDCFQKSLKLLDKKKLKLKLGDFVRISKHKGCFEKGYTPNWSTEIFKVIKINKTCPITYSIEDQRKQNILGSFYEFELQKTKHPYLYLVEKVLRKKGNKVYVKWLGMSDKENSWIDKNNIVK